MLSILAIAASHELNTHSHVMMLGVPGSRLDHDDTADTAVLPVTPSAPLPTPLPPSATQRRRLSGPPGSPSSSVPDPVLRVWIEELPPGARHRPETNLHFSAGRTVLNVVGSRQVVAAALKTVTGELARAPWWMFWARRR